MDQDLRDRLLAMDTMAVFEVMSHYLDRVGHQLQQARTTHVDGTAAAWIAAQLGALREFGEQVPFENGAMIDATEVADQWAAAVAHVVSALPSPRPDGPDLLSLIVTREEVEAQDPSRILTALRTMLDSPEDARKCQGILDLRVAGYDGHRDELFEIDAVRDFIRRLDDEFPYWLFFASTKTSSLQMIALCHLPPFLTEEGKREHFGPRLHDLLTRRWIPALNEIAVRAGLGPAELEALSDDAIGYFTTPASAFVR